ncbi:MAG: LysM peptidoglycan-binding domain-containing protein [Pseudomonadota bacterium]
MAIAFLKLGAQLLAGTAAAGTVAVATGVVKLDNVTGWFDAVNQTPQIVAKLAIPDTTKSTQQVVDESAKTPVKDQAAKPEPTIAETPKPKFDVLRVEEDGSMVVAGNGPGDALVQMLLPDGTVVGESKSGPEGDFVIIPNKNLPAGDHILTLQAMPEGSDEKIASAQSSVVHIPGREQKTEVLAMITEDGAASRIVAKPKALQAPAPVAAIEPKEAPKADRKPKPAPAKMEPEQVQPKPQLAAKPIPTPQVDAKKPEAIQPQAPVAKAEPAVKPLPKPAKKAEPKRPAPTAPAPVVVEAVEVEGRKVFVAGAVKRGTPVRVYINNKSLGVTKGTVDDRFLIAKDFNLNSGEHTVRADVLDRKTGTVSARAEVPLVHERLEETSQAEIAARTVPTPAPALKKVIEDKTDPQTVASTKPVIVQNDGEADAGIIHADTAQTAAATQENVQKSVESPVSEQQAVIRTGRAVIIKPGDNLWRISRKTYGRGIRYTTIYNANRDQIRDPSRIYIGQIFKIPEKYTQ